MGWAVGDHNGRDIGYGVPAICDQPGCSEEIDRGLSFVCGSEPYGGEYGCGLFFCGSHLFMKNVKNRRTIQVPGEEIICNQLCERCFAGKEAFDPKPDIAEWINHKLTDETWQKWRDENPEEVENLRLQIDR